ncbi:hypothetical protein [Massilibacteroides sp.]|uniref:hypothetical protein n=1 Tax=Massilibacteroides sp. TaxID=2034766 RepID=UPI00261C5B3F|nr:hypothetical protein [Massilibacteroides sp.]MDD4516337.1 hypothetical protein [Massilibacteroides sp.]
MTSQYYLQYAFKDCPALTNITITGTISCPSVNFQSSTLLTTASLLSILTALNKTAGSGKSITFSTTHQSKINADSACTAQYNNAITAGWTFAFI